MPCWTPLLALPPAASFRGQLPCTASGTWTPSPTSRCPCRPWSLACLGRSPFLAAELTESRRFSGCRHIHPTARPAREPGDGQAAVLRGHLCMPPASGGAAARAAGGPCLYKQGRAQEPPPPGACVKDQEHHLGKGMGRPKIPLRIHQATLASRVWSPCPLRSRIGSSLAVPLWILCRFQASSPFCPRPPCPPRKYHPLKAPDCRIPRASASTTSSSSLTPPEMAC